MLLAVLIFVLFASPVIHAVQAPISGLIFGFALWEAWKINKRVQVALNGPFRVSSCIARAGPRGRRWRMRPCFPCPMVRTSLSGVRKPGCAAAS